MITTAKDLRVRTKAILEAVARGEEVLITHRGRNCARILPVLDVKSKSSRRRSSTALFGIWKANRSVADIGRHIDKLRAGRGA